MFGVILWWLFYPFSQVLYSAEDMGIEETQVSWKWSGVIILSVIVLYAGLRLFLN